MTPTIQTALSDFRADRDFEACLSKLKAQGMTHPEAVDAMFEAVREEIEGPECAFAGEK